ncbi:MAG: hypothetical protein NC344_01245 [Bacteroidales bacterium]|nr:hypothetical protein [Bacteroidales bacterium]MCM1146462.1 hypothetical protein [Bacteroidales bacterium]MCM1205100.1 hypothetical protein [Bacillota bacterium]MCM1509346.1 hypothetical protein [Clostridium sp.]
MARSKMFNHDDDFDAVQDEPQNKTQPQEVKCPLENATLRQMRLMERNNDMASEFRELKPEIVRTHALLEAMNKNTGALAGTMINLLDLLKSSFPIRFSPEEKAKLQHELDGIADKMIENIRKECNQVTHKINQNEKRISLSPVYFWTMIVAIIVLSLFFILVIFANIEIIHNHSLSKLIILFVVFCGITFCAISYAYYKYKQ